MVDSPHSYPTKPIRIIAPYPPGAGTDIIARAVGQKLGEAVGQQVIVDNRGGGAGIIGTDAIAKSLPDGYTIGLVTSTFSMMFSALPSAMPFISNAKAD